ncbi:uncharacterized protein LOC112588581 isoform X2 [Harpegnathos saltator]|uniref:uncharacterized protein LOC112588581 isoform X2 n=1 Tax=Harpegnathos saltator TaxID=610380 RepID=UPI000DBED5DD|nr:uncharacterized protein LOC112588581 isoform X2 [Harpegnathos saltator]
MNSCVHLIVCAIIRCYVNSTSCINMPSCSVPGCCNRTTKGKKIHMACFPSDPKRKEKTRVDGKRKLKCNAVPTIFSVPSERSGTCIITNDSTNKSVEKQPNIMFETLDHQASIHEDVTTKQNNCLGSDVSDITPLISNPSISSHSNKTCNEVDDVQWLKKLEEVNKKLDIANKIILKSN